MSSRFAFAAAEHEYIDTMTGQTLPHITGLLQFAGLTPNERFYTEQARDRGSEVHRMTAAFDQGAIENVSAVVSRYKGWLQAHVDAMFRLLPNWSHIEEALIHEELRFGGRPDRVGSLAGCISVVDIKSGTPEKKAHAIQTALQAILVAPEVRLPPESIERYCLYLKPTGKWRLEPYRNRGDIFEAHRILARYQAEVAA